MARRLNTWRSVKRCPSVVVGFATPDFGISGFFFNLLVTCCTSNKCLTITKSKMVASGCYPTCIPVATASPSACMPDWSAKLDALRQVSTLLSQKQDVPDDLWAKAGLKAGTRLKDVSNEITKTKKLVSSQAKDEDDGDEDGEAGAAAGKPGATAEHRKDERLKKDVRRLGADTKSAQLAMARGEFDLKNTQLFHGSDGVMRDADD